MVHSHCTGKGPDIASIGSNILWRNVHTVSHRDQDPLFIVLWRNVHTGSHKEQDPLFPIIGEMFTQGLGPIVSYCTSPWSRSNAVWLSHYSSIAFLSETGRPFRTSSPILKMFYGHSPFSLQFPVSVNWFIQARFVWLDLGRGWGTSCSRKPLAWWNTLIMDLDPFLCYIAVI